jgi:hypothetical protein
MPNRKTCGQKWVKPLSKLRAGLRLAGQAGRSRAATLPDKVSKFELCRLTHHWGKWPMQATGNGPTEPRTPWETRGKLYEFVEYLINRANNHGDETFDYGIEKIGRTLDIINLGPSAVLEAVLQSYRIDSPFNRVSLIGELLHHSFNLGSDLYYAALVELSKSDKAQHWEILSAFNKMFREHVKPHQMKQPLARVYNKCTGIRRQDIGYTLKRLGYVNLLGHWWSHRLVSFVAAVLSAMVMLQLVFVIFPNDILEMTYPEAMDVVGWSGLIRSSAPSALVSLSAFAIVWYLSSRLMKRRR